MQCEGRGGNAYCQLSLCEQGLHVTKNLYYSELTIHLPIYELKCVPKYIKHGIQRVQACVRDVRLSSKDNRGLFPTRF